MASAFPPIDLILWLVLWVVATLAVLACLYCRLRSKRKAVGARSGSGASAGAADARLDAADEETGLRGGEFAEPSVQKQAAVAAGTTLGCLAFCYLFTCALIALIMGVWGASFFITPEKADACTACAGATCCNYNPSNIAFNDVTFASGSNTIHGWTMENATFPTGAPGAPWLYLLYNHGSGANLAVNYRTERYEFLLSLGRVKLMVYDYPGYGKSTGEAEEADIKASALDAFAFFKTEFAVSDSDVTMLGRSLGGMTTAHINRNHPTTKNIITQSTFNDISKVAGSYFPVTGYIVESVFPVSFNDDGIDTFRGCWHQSHSKDDEWVPIRFGRDLFDDASGAGTAPGATCTKKFLEVSGPLHDDPMSQAEKDSLRAFVAANR